MKRLAKRALAPKLTNHTGYAPHADQAESDNALTGSNAETVETDQWLAELAVPRCRADTFEPIVVKNRQRQLEDLLTKS